MSNIEDITPLSDFLSTSPREPVETTSKLQLERSKVVTDEVVPHISESQSEVAKLLHQASEKVDLNDTRSRLLKERQKLRQDIEELNVKIHHLQQKQQKQKDENILTNLLRQNSDNFAKSVPSIEYDEQLESLSVSPSNDWQQRLKSVKLFCPYLEIENISTTNHYDNSLGELMRVIDYNVISPLLFNVSINITIESRHDSVSGIKIDPNELCQLCPSFSRVLRSNYIPQRKINLAMYGMNSLSLLVHKRIETLYQLIRLLPGNVNQRKFGDLIKREEESDKIKLFAMLKLVDSLSLTFVVADVPLVVTLQWEVVLSDTVTGECESKLNLAIRRNDKLYDCNSLFLDLCQSYGIISALRTILKNSFDIEI